MRHLYFAASCCGAEAARLKGAVQLSMHAPCFVYSIVCCVAEAAGLKGAVLGLNCVGGTAALAVAKLLKWVLLFCHAFDVWLSFRADLSWRVMTRQQPTSFCISHLMLRQDAGLV